MSDVPELTFDMVFVGQRFRESELALSREMVADYGRAVHNSALEAQANDEPGTPVKDPSLIILFSVPRRILVNQYRMPPGGVLARQDFEIVRLPRLGETIRTLPHIAKKYEKRGRRYVEMQCDLVDQESKPIGTAFNHIIWAK